MALLGSYLRGLVRMRQEALRSIEEPDRVPHHEGFHVGPVSPLRLLCTDVPESYARFCEPRFQILSLHAFHPRGEAPITRRAHAHPERRRTLVLAQQAIHPRELLGRRKYPRPDTEPDSPRYEEACHP